MISGAEGCMEKTSLQPYIDYFSKQVVTPVLKIEKVSSSLFPCVEGEELMENSLVDAVEHQLNNIQKAHNDTTTTSDTFRSACDW
jgi:hypothetical protein